MTEEQFMDTISIVCESVALQLDAVANLLPEDKQQDFDLKVLSALVGGIAESLGMEHGVFLDEIKRNLDQFVAEESREEKIQDAKRFIS